jgi:hypothetical protein
MAGILFTDKNMVIAGYNSSVGQIVGIGGKSKENELPYQTAVRETIEELFEFEYLDESVLRTLTDALNFDMCIASPDYTTFIMSFQDLEFIMHFLSFHILKSRVYPFMPRTINELLFLRVDSDNAELSRLVLLPCTSNIAFNNYFLSDLETFNKM